MSTLCKWCGAHTTFPFEVYEDGSVAPKIGTFPMCPGHPGQVPMHSGDLGHGSTAYYKEDPYEGEQGQFCINSVMISDKTHAQALIPREALSLLAWLQQEKETLEWLVEKEDARAVGA